MPTYDYKCLDCNYTFEEFQKMTDEPLQVCPNCKGKLTRLIGTGSAPIFKGSGFYQTDYKKTSSPSEGKTKTESSAVKDSVKDTKTKKDS